MGGKGEFDDDAVHELIALAAVNALDADEQAELDTVVAFRPDLAAELAELRAIAAATLGEDGAEAPPSHVREAVLATIATTPQDAGVAAVQPTAEPTPLSSARRNRGMTWGFAAAAAAVVALSVGVLIARDDGDTVGNRIAAVADDPNVVTIPLTGELEGLLLHHGPRSGDTVLVGSDVPALSDDQVYELWLLVGDDAPARVEVFRPAADGSVGVLMPDMTPPDGATFAVTVEPSGGTDAPTGSVVASS